MMAEPVLHVINLVTIAMDFDTGPGILDRA
jgi:hypothetical protein